MAQVALRLRLDAVDSDLVALAEDIDGRADDRRSPPTREMALGEVVTALAAAAIHRIDDTTSCCGACGAVGDEAHLPHRDACPAYTVLQRASTRVATYEEADRYALAVGAEIAARYQESGNVNSCTVNEGERSI